MAIIIHVEEADFLTLVNLWEASVRATHDFLTDEDIRALRSQVLNDYLPAVELRLYLDDDNNIAGFLGVYEQKIEMLFIDPSKRGKGIGKALMEYAIQEMGADEVDVNEQNPQAVGFYEHLGFQVVGRSELDGQGRPFPLLQMRYCR